MVTLPSNAVQLATSASCPVQAFRVGSNVYATQFHPELDLEGVCTRIEVYKNAGYFPPGEAETLKERSRSVPVEHPMTVLANFVVRYRR
jgi:GMP synthase (glutamine-hydrolysing)